MFDKISELIVLIVWIWSVTYLLGLLIMGIFGKWKKFKEDPNRHHRITLRNESGDPLGILFTHERKTDDEAKEKKD